MIMYYKASSTERGFTLVELLVVIAIIAIITAIAVPAFLNQRKKANDALLRNDIKNVAQAMETWYVDNPFGVMPPDPTRGHWSFILSGGNSRFVGGGHSPSTELPDGFIAPKLAQGSAVGAIARGYSLNEGSRGNYCLVGNMRGSNHFVPDGFLQNSTTGSSYQFALFYDSAAGGLHTPHTLPSNGACKDYYASLETYGRG